MRFAEREAQRLLQPQKLSLFNVPLWIGSVHSYVERRPFGVVLIIGPGNYPLMLPGIQVVQALAAGNAVAIKPAPGCTSVMCHFVSCLYRAGIPQGLVEILAEDAGPIAARAAFDLIVLTGSEQSGRAVARAAAETLTPTIMELSGADPVFVLEGANIDRVVKALLFGLRLNNGATCIAPRRVFATPEVARMIEKRLVRTLSGKKTTVAPEQHDNCLDRAILAAGGNVIRAGQATLYTGKETIAPVLEKDLFLPWIGIIAVNSLVVALTYEQNCRFALGASIFGPERAARAFARSLPAGSICINDMIVPTADPRLPFGGARKSGYGVTRGREGLLAMTRPVTLSIRKGLAWHLL